MPDIGIRQRLPAPAQSPVFHPWVTVLCAALLAAAIGYLFVMSRTHSDLAALHFPGESAGRMLDRHMEFYEGYQAVPAWQRAFFTLLFGSREKVQGDAIRAYREVLRYFHEHPREATPWAQFNTRARLLIALGETGRLAVLRRELDRMNGTLDDEMLRGAIRFGYFGQRGGASVSDILYGLRLMPLGWSADHLDLRISNRLGYHKHYQVVEQRLLAHGARWRDRVLLLAAVIGALSGAGLWVWLRRRPALGGTAVWRAAALDTPWRLMDGFAVLVRAGLLGVTISALLHIFTHSYFRPGVFALWSTLFASLPLVWMIHSRLLRPRGLTFARAFGLTLRRPALPGLARSVVALLALEWCGTLLIAWLAWQLGVHGHWSDGIYEREIFGSWQTAALSGVNLVLWAPLFEEIGFRGLLYGSLRSRLSPAWAIPVSAAVFSSLHMYSLIGFVSVFWSGIVLAYAFERSRSLLPGMMVHAAGNLLAMNTVLLFYR